MNANRQISTVGPVGLRIARSVELLRMVNGMDQQDVARAMRERGCGMDAQGYRQFIQGQRRLDVDDLYALADIFHVPAGDLLTKSVDVSFSLKSMSTAMEETE